jgi:hypothetical protein
VERAVNLAPLAVQQFFDNNGRPLVGGLLFTYISGTSTKQATYTDAGGGSQNTNPIVLDFRGEAQIWMPLDATYTFVLARRGDTDPPTNPIWSVDGISSALTFFDVTQAFIGLRLWPRSAAEIAAGVTPVNYGHPWGSFERYGMDPLGVTSSTSAFEVACSCNARVFDEYPGGGTYLFSTQADISAYPLTISGQAKGAIGSATGAGTTFVIASAAGSGASIIRFTSFSDVTVENIKFLTQNLGDAQIGIRFGQLRASLIRNCSFFGPGDVTDDSTGIQFDGTSTNPSEFTGGVVVDNCYLSNHQFGINMQGVITDLHIISCTLYGTVGHASSRGINIASPQITGPSIIGCGFNIWFRCIYATGSRIKQGLNRFEDANPQWEWVVGTSVENQSFGDEITGGGVPIYSTLDAHGNQVWGQAGAFAASQNIITTRAYREASRTFDMGYPQTVPFNAGDYTASGAMTWTVGSGNVTSFLWALTGKTLTIWLAIAGSTAGGVASTTLSVKIPGGFTAAAALQQPFTIENNGVFTSIGSVSVAASGTVMDFFIDAAVSGNWTLSANTGMSGFLQIPIA